MPDDSPAIFYHPDGFDVAGRPLVGRRVAGRSFLDAWIGRHGAGTLSCYSATRRVFKTFCDVAQAGGATGNAQWIPHSRPEILARIGALFYPGPDIADQCWRRFRIGSGSWSVIGITHTICTKVVMDGIFEWDIAPLEPWDAVICTSKAVHDSIVRQTEVQRDYLSRRLGAPKFSGPALPIVPLGVPTEDFAEDKQLRSQTRRTRDIAEDDVVALFVGRLSRYEKAHPIPMFIALQQAARAAPKDVHLLLVGWFPDDGERTYFLKAASQWAPSIKVQIIDGRNLKDRMGAWQAADVFVSLVDNIQETFGLTPVEAMAAGLPSVVSDWDGYRDTVRDGIDGFRIPTMTPPAMLGHAPADKYAADLYDYKSYLADTSSMVVVDIDAASAALRRLFADPDLRARFGSAARQRAVSRFDWQVVLGEYQTLFDDLAELRRAATSEKRSTRGAWTTRLSPFEIFASYATETSQPVNLVAVTSRASRTHIEAIHAAEMRFVDGGSFSVDDAVRMVEIVRGASRLQLGRLLENYAPELRPRMLKYAHVLAKYGIISIIGT